MNIEALEYNKDMTGKGTEQPKKKVSPISGVAPPAGFEKYPERRNNGGIPKYVREIREEIKNLLDPNLTIADYQKMIKDAGEDSGLRGVFATAIVKKDYRTILALIDQGFGKPKESVDVTSKGESINPYQGLSTDELRKLIGK